MNGGPEYYAQFAVLMPQPNLFDLLRVKERLEIDNVRIANHSCIACIQQESGSTVGANGVSYNCFNTVIDVIAGRADLDR